MNIDYEKVYEGYARDEIHKFKWQMKKMSDDELKECVERKDPAGFLEDHGLYWYDAMVKIAAAELLQERKKKEQVEQNKASDVSQSTNVDEIIQEIRRLNPGVEIQVDGSEMANRVCYISVPIEQLKLPNGFEYNEKNGITNKHHTSTGQYVTLDVKPLQSANPLMLMPEAQKVVKNEKPYTAEKFKRVKDVIVSAAKKLYNKIQSKIQERGGINARNR